MKKIISLLLLVAITISLFAGCASKTDPAPAGDPAASETATSTTEPPTEADATEGQKSVVLIVNTNLGDKSFCDLSNSGMMKAAEELGMRTKVVELNGDATKQVPTFIEFADSGEWDIIISGTYNIKEAMQEVAADYPDQLFVLYDAKADYEDGENTNIYSIEHMQNEGSFLVGAAAARMTSSKQPGMNDQKVIGFIAGNENTAINDFMVGYIEGAKYVDPEIKVLVSYIGDFKDSAKAKELAFSQISQGADVVFGVAGGAGLGVLDACKEKGVYAIGVDSDQAMEYKESDPEMAKTIITSMVKRVDSTVYNAITTVMAGNDKKGVYETVGIKDGSIGMARNEFYEAAFTTEDKAFLDELEQKVVNGEIEVKTAIGMAPEELQEIKNSVTPK